MCPSGRSGNCGGARPRAGSFGSTAIVVALLIAAPVTASAQSSRVEEPLSRKLELAVSDTRPAGVVRSNDALGDKHSALSATGAVGLLSPSVSASPDVLQPWQSPGPRTSAFQVPARQASWLAPLASAVVPGTGQALLKQQRSLAYVVAETFLVLRAVQSNKDYRTARDRYRELAADVARVKFGAVRPVGPWEYYEEMVKFDASGVYSSGGPGQLIPETDVSTFNGKQWLLARQQFWTNANVPPAPDKPEYKRALDFYASRAVKDSFLWSWRDQTLAQTEFRERITESNNSNQRYVTAVSFVAANHIVSLIDAYITVRLRRYGGAGLSSASLNTTLVPMGIAGDRRYGMALGVTIPVAGIR